jgi:diguanylate cyclase (GGDEF)-like protein/PAS domain S-box-containing protein
MLTQLSIDQLQGIFLSLPVATCLLDREMRYVAASQKYAALLDTSLAGLKGKAMMDFCPPDLVANARRDFCVLDSGERIADHEITFKGKAYLVSVNPVYHDTAASVAAISVTLTDISQLKKLEASLTQSNHHLFTAYKQIRALAETDSLTGLFNRHGMEVLLTKEIRRARREQTAVAAVMVDVDWFKLYNDGNGHVAGDAALKLVGQAILSAIRRSGDWAARYGGEEFFVVLPNTDVEGAHQVATNIWQAVNGLALAHPESPYGRLTISLGVAGIATVARDADVAATCEQLLHQADKALYVAKAAGRSTVKMCDES